MLIARKVLGEVGRTFLSSLLATTGVVFLMLSLSFMRRSPGISIGVIVQIFPLFFPLALQFTLPFSMLSAVITTFGRMAGDRELVALSASGISPITVARPVLAFAAVVSLSSLLLTDALVPHAEKRLRKAGRNILQHIQTSFRAGLSDLDLGRGRLSFETFHGNRFTDVCLEYEQSEDNVSLWRAQSGTITITPDERVVLELENAREVSPAPTREGKIVKKVRDIALVISLSDIINQPRRSRRQNDMAAWELTYLYGRDMPRRASVRTHSNKAGEEIARRSALAAAAFFFALIGIPLGIISAKSGKIGAFLLASLPVLLAYYPLLIGASNLARSDKLPPYPALWTGNAVLGIAAFVLYRKVGNKIG